MLPFSTRFKNTVKQQIAAIFILMELKTKAGVFGITRAVVGVSPTATNLQATVNPLLLKILIL